MLVVGNVGPKSDHVERSDLPKRFFIAGWERERAKIAKREPGESQEKARREPRKRSRKARGLNTPQWDSA
jgi:hypothetical protein